MILQETNCSGEMLETTVGNPLPKNMEKWKLYGNKIEAKKRRFGNPLESRQGCGMEFIKY
jgi:hypothetical protein